METKLDISRERWTRYVTASLMVLGLAIPLLSHVTSAEAAGLGHASLAAQPDGYPVGGADDPPDEPDLPDDNGVDPPDEPDVDLPDDNGVDPPDAPDAPDDGPHQGNGR